MSNPAIKTSLNNDVAIYPLKPHGHPLMGVASPSREEIRAKLLTDKIRHISMADIDALPILNAMSHMAFQARNLARASQIFEAMLRDQQCGIFLCLAGSLISTGLKQIIVEMIDNNMIDCICSTGANIVDQDFFEALGFSHYRGHIDIDDNLLREASIDRIYDTFIDEEELRICDDTIRQITDSLPPKPYSSREFIKHMGQYLVKQNKGQDSIVRKAFEKDIPIFVPAFSDCSAGFGLVHHQFENRGKPMVTLDSARDFLEITEVKLAAGESGIYMIGGGVPKNFVQDTVVAAEVLGKEVNMHKYAVQVTVADVRDGALSSSTLQEACSWGKVSMTYEQMVYCEASLAVPLISAYGLQSGAAKGRQARRFAKLFKD